MNSRNAVLSWFALAVPSLLLAANPPVPVDLGDLGDDPANPLDSIATSINESGQVVGWGSLPSGRSHAFLWPDKGKMRDLGAPSGEDSYATAINDAGVIAGNDETANGTRPWVWRNGQFTWLPIPPGVNGIAKAIEPNGVIAGCLRMPNAPTVSVTWSPFSVPQYKMTALPWHPAAGLCAISIDRAQNIALGGSVFRGGVYHPISCRSPGACYVYGMDVSGSGPMTGTDRLSPRYWPNLDFAPGISFVATFCDVASGGAGRAINANGQIVGEMEYCSTPNGTLNNAAFFWTADSDSLMLPPLNLVGAPGCCTVLTSLNSAAEVVGRSTISKDVSHATLWRVGWDITVIPLPECMPHPCHIPPEIWYIPSRFINDGIVTREGFDASSLDPRQITLGDGNGRVTKVAANADGSPMASAVDVNGDGIRDLQVGFNTSDLINDGVLTPDTMYLELSAVQSDGSEFHTRYPVWVRRLE
jgi:probable HAF family extracellular repeat protein